MEFIYSNRNVILTLASILLKYGVCAEYTNGKWNEIATRISERFDAPEESINTAQEIRGKSAVRRRQGYVKRFSRTSQAVNELNGPGPKAGVKGEFRSRALGEILDSALRTVNYHLARHPQIAIRAARRARGSSRVAMLREDTAAR